MLFFQNTQKFRKNIQFNINQLLRFILKTDIKFHLVQESDTFAVWDSVDGIVALGWEDVDDYDVYPESRLWFGFGLDIDEVNERLYERDLVLEYNKDKQVKK